MMADSHTVNIMTVTLHTMTVAQLTVLCREHKITGYSKLKKAALIEKLEKFRLTQSKGIDNTSSNNSENRNSRISPARPSSILNSTQNERATHDGNRRNSVSQAASQSTFGRSETSRPNVQEASGNPVDAQSSSTVPRLESSAFGIGHLSSRTLNQSQVSSSLAENHPDTSTINNAEVTGHASMTTSATNYKVSHSITESVVPLASLTNVALSRKREYSTMADPHTNTRQERPSKKSKPEESVKLLTGDRFRLLDVLPAPRILSTPKPSDQSTAKTKLPKSTRFIPLKPKTTTSQSNSKVMAVIDSVQTPDVCAEGLFDSFDIQEEEPLPLSNISLPPPLSQRKRIKSLALILHRLGDRERSVCCLSNRLLRYAAYVSAQFILHREFPGKRTATVLARAQDCLSNLWPYLRKRRDEVSSSKSRYASTFLASLAPNPMSDWMWSNPNGDESSTALKFTLSMLWFSIATGRNFVNEQIIGVRKHVGDEILLFMMQKMSTGEVYQLYVLSHTGEAIGCPSITSQGDQSTQNDQGNSTNSLHRVRSDWSLYISSVSHQSNSELGSSRKPTSLWERMKCENMEDYDQGLGKHWIQRVTSEGSLGLAKKRVAERYVLASVVANSISGEQLSYQQMAQQWSGIPGVSHPSRPNVLPHLFLPACENAEKVPEWNNTKDYPPLRHHHVESVHFTTRSGAELHPAVASVQTPHREYYILRENGLQIGCEEEGVCSTWMHILGCSTDGIRHGRVV